MLQQFSFLNQVKKMADKKDELNESFLQEILQEDVVTENPDLTIPITFADNKDGSFRIPNKPDHVLMIYRNFLVGLCTDMEMTFSDTILKCHRWIVEAYMGMEHLKTRPTSLEKFVSEYYCCLKAPELPLVLRAYYRCSDTHDIFIHIGEEEFRCHLDVLRCYTDFFSQSKQFEIVKLPETEVSVRAFFMIYKGWMLDQIPDIPFRGIIEVYRAANYLQIEFLSKNLSFAIQKQEAEELQKGLNSIADFKPPKLVNKFIVEKV